MKWQNYLYGNFFFSKFPDQENLDKSSDLSTNESRIVDTSVAMGDIITDSETSFEMLPDYTQNGATEMPLGEL